MPKPATIYRTLLRDAWNVTWQNKSLWVFGLFAGFIATGGVIDTLITGLKSVNATGTLLERLLDRSFIGYSYASQFILQVYRIGSSQFSYLLIFATLVLLGLISAGVLSQAALVHGAGADPKKHPRAIRRHVMKHFWQVLLIDLLTKVLSMILLTLTSLPIVLLSISTGRFAWLAFIHLFVYIPAIIILYILSILSIIDVVESDSNALHAIFHAVQIFKTHWLAAFEYGLILFLLVMSAGLLFLATLGVLSWPYGVLHAFALTAGSTTLYILVNLITAIILFALVLTFGGMVVTFQYSAWQTFYLRATHGLHGTKSFAKIWRILFV